jgi:hypothetical protein
MEPAVQSSSIPVPLLVGLIIIAWPIAFGLLWGGIVWLMAQIGGWSRLARHYPGSKVPPEGRVLASATGMIGLSSYKRVLRIVVTAEGLYLSVWRIFSIAHPPLFIPWSAIHDATGVSMIFRRYVSFEVGSPTVARLRLPFEAFVDSPVKID